MKSIGTLLGSVNDGVVTISTCYPVPHVEKSDSEVAIGKEFNRVYIYIYIYTSDGQYIYM